MRPKTIVVNWPLQADVTKKWHKSPPTSCNSKKRCNKTILLRCSERHHDTSRPSCSENNLELLNTDWGIHACTIDIHMQGYNALGLLSLTRSQFPIILAQSMTLSGVSFNYLHAASISQWYSAADHLPQSFLYRLVTASTCQSFLLRPQVSQSS